MVFPSRRARSKEAESGGAEPDPQDERALTVYLDSELLEVGFTLLYNDQRELFAHSSGLMGVRVSAPPRVRLCPEAEGHDLTLLAPVELEMAGVSSELTVLVRGKLEIHGGVACLGQLAVEFDATRRWERKILEAALARFTAEYEHIELPDLLDMFRPEIDARLVDAHVCEVQGVPYVRLMAGVGADAGVGAPSLIPAPLPPAFAPELATAGPGSIVVIIPEWIIGASLSTIFPGYVYRLDKKLGRGGMRLRTKGNIEFDALRVSFARGHVDADVHVTFDKIKVGIKVFDATDWERVKLKATTVDVRMKFGISADRRAATLTVDEVEKPKVKIRDKGGADDEVRQVVKDMAKTVSKVLRDRINDTQFDLLDLPEVVPGTSLPMSIRFGPKGIDIHERALVADGRLSFDDEAGAIVRPPRYWEFQELGGVRLHLRERGEGRPIVFIHDLGLSLDCWEHQIDHFSRRFRPLAYDWRGMGFSAGGRSPYPLRTLVDELEALLRARDMSRAVLVGQGMGAAIALSHARHHPDRTIGVVLCGGARGPLKPALRGGFGGPSAKRAQSMLWREDYQREHPRAMATWRQRFSSNSKLALLSASFAWMRAPSMRALLAELRKPTLLIRGAGEAPSIAAQDLREVVLDEPTNLPMLEQSAAFDGALEAFMDELVDGDEAGLEARPDPGDGPSGSA